MKKIKLQVDLELNLLDLEKIYLEYENLKDNANKLGLDLPFEYTRENVLDLAKAVLRENAMRLIESPYGEEMVLEHLEKLFPELV